MRLALLPLYSCKNQRKRLMINRLTSPSPFRRRFLSPRRPIKRFLGIASYSTILSYKVIHNWLTDGSNSADKTGDHMSRRLAAATALFVAAGSWSAAGQQSATVGTRPGAKTAVQRVAAAQSEAPILIRGNALDSDNGPLPAWLMRLRDARLG